MNSSGGERVTFGVRRLDPASLAADVRESGFEPALQILSPAKAGETVLGTRDPGLKAWATVSRPLMRTKRQGRRPTKAARSTKKIDITSTRR